MVGMESVKLSSAEGIFMVGMESVKLSSAEGIFMVGMESVKLSSAEGIFMVGMGVCEAFLSRRDLLNKHLIKKTLKNN